MAKAQGQISQIFPEYILRDKSRACKQRFKECFQIPGLGYDDWLEQRCAEFNWWMSGLNADKRGPESLDAKLKLRPDVMEIISTALDGLEGSLSSYYGIGRVISLSILHPQCDKGFDSLTSGSGLAKLSSQLPDGKSTGISEAIGQSMYSADVERSPSPWSDMSDSSHNYTTSATSGYGIYYEPRVYIVTNLEILIRIHTAIKRSSLKFSNQRADEALKQADEFYQRQKAASGEHSALQGQNGEHERFRRYLTKLVLWNGYTQSLIQRMNFRIAKLDKAFKSKDKNCSQILLQEKKLLVIFRAYFQDPARLTTIQRRLINANVIRRNRLIYASSATKHPSQVKEENQKPPKPSDVVHQSVTVNRAKTVLTSSQLQPQLIEPDELTKGSKKTIESLVVQPATATDSRFTVTGALAPPSVNKSAETKFSARVDYLDYPKCPVQHGQFPCPYCSTILTDEYTEKAEWRRRGHVAQDLCAYICVFEDCNSPDDMFPSTYEWMSHMSRFHSAIDWVCTVCAKHSASSIRDDSVLSFPSSALLKEHILTSHPILDPAELDLLVEASKRTLEIQRVRCPLCRVGLVTLEYDDEDGISGMTSIPPTGQEIGLIRLEEDEHIATHIHEFALQSLPYRQEATSEGSQVSLSQSHPQFTFQDLKSPQATKYMERASAEQPPLYHHLEDVKTFGGEDVDTFAISLNKCRVTVSQVGDLTLDDITKEALRYQLLNDLNHSNEILQQAFTSTLDTSIGQGEEVQAKNPQTDNAQIKDAKPQEHEEKVSKNRGVEPKEQERKKVRRREPESEPASETAQVPNTKTSTTNSTFKPPATQSSVTKGNGRESDGVKSDLEYPDLKSSKHTESPIVDKEKGLATTDTPISDGPRFSTPQDIQENINGFIRKADLGSFFPNESTYIPTVTNNAFEFKNNKDNLLNRDIDIQGVTRLNLYQPVLYCDDSSSMKASTRVDDQKDMVRRVTRISTFLVPPGHGTSLQFINHVRDIHDNKLSQREVKAIMNSVKPTGHTKIGTNLKKKILQPLVYDVINNKGIIERPILVSCITGGCLSREPVDQFKETILECIRILKENGYPPSTIKFQVSQIGNSSRADKYLKQLQHDDDLKGVVYCTALSYYLQYDFG
ncbi:hypothetical protein TRIATDRAFT_84408 [Trichoderma atroviride IMI 206040]|uniref:Uncharacterized protein n=1 Tax=Hypocrea atroviridis (strain ATCC 20476 / IMI 206040) TaxID=452589 RepID=G9P8U1_HYPAI|nr:uncharacterized protein TRIATDRAFT_84408 [Trichoderma atroviride IMI 206040]EHK41813.1 hypothetical protein TRIATDRAFT_84408 [Trichoderma atroviride IMI 206040]